MKSVAYYFLLPFFAFSFFNCSDDNSEEDELIGTWNLVEYNVGIAVDLNNDGFESFNLLDEVDCEFSEAFLVNSESNWTSTIEHDLQILAIQNNALSKVVLSITCSDGIISGIGQLSQEARQSYLVEGTKLTKNYTDAISVYNEDSSEVIANLTITKIYQKQ